ncbi:NAD(P)-dependent iron-only hydrogenase diaphorase component iron-sulfur protein [Clostridium cavendishii DSM 21758]|uniref:NAD(P)-dependent iron-only hydrogenase diaphorase component iron-sulfur protein n=1 Tax=Clostridium cavendishii DSM 21758 TaxID=1121302 RepID=A0A1M6ERB4_9CLOT|nr:NAD(P)H-dependent oxidoreductase subunit E [Clostridium cavendishii]SHI87963.1 NAD(P)-dependent iron-only hydrogenase diaphorase component iron-sulfur protein [Clostridium cavendishii DSM 21758]
MVNVCGSSGKFKELVEFIETQKGPDGSLIGVLHKAQSLYGYLGEEVISFISKEMNIPESKIYGVITFYSYFTTEPKGKYVISVCTGTACFVRGAGDILEEFKKELSIKPGETTDDGKYTLDTIRCVGACGIAPVVSINDKIYGKCTKSQVKEILKELEGQE